MYMHICSVSAQFSSVGAHFLLLLRIFNSIDAQMRNFVISTRIFLYRSAFLVLSMSKCAILLYRYAFLFYLWAKAQFCYIDTHSCSIYAQFSSVSMYSSVILKRIFVLSKHSFGISKYFTLKRSSVITQHFILTFTVKQFAVKRLFGIFVGNQRNRIFIRLC